VKPLELPAEDLRGCLVVEVGCGRGGTTRRLVELLEGVPGARLIATDLSDAHFTELQQEFHSSGVRVDFLQTDACSLEGISDGSADFLVCCYTLCAVEAQPGRGALALARFVDVLKPEGVLLLEEEYPIDQAVTLQQQVWAEKWRILKTAQEIAGEKPYREFAPEDLSALSQTLGFSSVTWETGSTHYSPEDFFDFFARRLERLVNSFPSSELRQAFRDWAARLHTQAAAAQGMEVPCYRLVAFRAA
jgi:ubiquinone/menaquinone biosynthesis C-methylase UbiE